MSHYIPLILFTVFTNFGSQVLLKKGMMSVEIFDLNGNGILKAIPSVITNPFVITGILMMIISMASHLVVLSRVEISYAYPFIGLSFVLITLYGYYFLSEDINPTRVAGVLSIVIGVILISKS